MNRLWAHIWAASFFTCLGGMFLPACAHDDSTLFVQQVVFPPTPTNQLGCLYQAPNTTTPGEFSGALDVGLASSYSPIVIIGNQLVPRGDATQARTETNRVQLRGAVVRVTNSQGDQISTFTSLTEGVVDPSTGQTPGITQAALTIVDPATANALRATLTNRAARQTILTFFKVFGQTLGGTYVESGEFQHVINVCNGCLLTFPSDAVDQKFVTPTDPTNCEAGFPVGTQLSGATIALPCVTGQDQPIDCRLCHDNPICDPRNSVWCDPAHPVCPAGQTCQPLAFCK
jgi:hypothetical protein